MESGYCLQYLVLDLKGSMKQFISMHSSFDLSFRILGSQILWLRQMPKLETRNRIYLITWEVNTA